MSIKLEYAKLLGVRFGSFEFNYMFATYPELKDTLDYILEEKRKDQLAFDSKINYLVNLLGVLTNITGGANRGENQPYMNWIELCKPAYIKELELENGAIMAQIREDEKEANKARLKRLLS